MGAASISLILLVSAMTSVIVYIVLPVFNSHLIVNREALLKEKIQIVMQENRFTPDKLRDRLANIDKEIDGVNFTNIQVKERGQYIIAEITYSESKLFLNKFNNESINKRRKTSSFIIDKVSQ